MLKKMSILDCRAANWINERQRRKHYQTNGLLRLPEYVQLLYSSLSRDLSEMPDYKPELNELDRILALAKDRKKSNGVIELLKTAHKLGSIVFIDAPSVLENQDSYSFEDHNAPNGLLVASSKEISEVIRSAIEKSLNDDERKIVEFYLELDPDRKRLLRKSDLPLGMRPVIFRKSLACAMLKLKNYLIANRPDFVDEVFADSEPIAFGAIDVMATKQGLRVSVKE
ncbi:MAG: hypothetical protein R3A13_03975 [Bdellovibrionota bacterium]